MLKLPADLVVHSLRHSFLTRLDESGCDVFTLMKIAGHSRVDLDRIKVDRVAKETAQGNAGVDTIFPDAPKARRRNLAGSR